jgi:hypothetical protein
MQRLSAASCLLLALLFGAVVRLTAEKVKVQVIQTHTGVRLGSDAVNPANEFDRALSRCSGNTGTYSREFGFYCGDSRLSPPVAENRRVDALFYDVHVIMPDAAQLVLHCSTILDSECEGFPVYPEDTSVVCSDFVYGGAAYKDCIARGQSAQGIGIYRAALHGDRVTIFGSHWHRHYLQYGTWRLEGRYPQEPKPGSPPESQEPKPAEPDKKSPTDGANESNAAEPADAKVPVLPTTGASPGSDHVIDPHIIEQAKAGDPASQYTLGYDYFLGRGVPVDYVQAAIWWRKAADQGYAEAQNNLGVLYNSGKGVPQSYAEAYFWQNLAAARATGSLQAQFAKNRDESASKLWLLTRLKVQQRAAKWAADHPVPPRSHEPSDAKRAEYP